MKIVADKNVPFLEGVFEPYADVVYIEGKDISRMVPEGVARFIRENRLYLEDV